uniref:HsdS n=1 Tax=Corynebacterium glutamicum TaxID=1718 RepID=A0A142EAM3_CORGT|nr:restriction endonuclease subunit S [Corynebacterium glutamicum]AMQ45211.1 HsdS [Corynebacterium glutamicum]
MNSQLELTWSDLGETYDGPHATPKRISEGPYFLNISSLVNGRLELSQSDHVSEDEFTKWTRRVTPQEGDLLFSYETRLGEAALMPGGIKACLGRRMALLRPNRDVIYPRFLLYYYLSPAFQRLIEQNTIYGATVNRISLSTMGKWPVSIPQLSEQQAIAEVLGALDDKIAANSMKASTAEQLAGVLFDKVSVDLKKIPVSQVLTPILGGTPNRKNPEFWGGQVHWASAKDVTSAPHSVVADTEEKITRMATEQTKAKPLPIGGVIVTARGTVGAVARLALPTSFNQSCYGFSPSELPPGLLYFSILRAAQRAKSLSHGSVFDTITMKTFDHLFIPDFGESAEKMEHQIAPLLETVDSSIKENKTLVSMRDALLPQLMSGKLRVRDAEEVVENVL